MTKIAPSILAADFSRLGAECDAVARAGADMLHIDVMDGHFVPNISFAFPVIKSLRRVSDMFFDVHLMISDPLFYAESAASSGADLITFHIEADGDPLKTIEKIRSLGCKVGISVKPATPAEAVFEYLPLVDLILIMSVEPGFGGQSFMPSALPKLSAVRDEAERIGKTDLLLEVDGGIDSETCKLVIAAGANLLVAGSSIFRADDYSKAINSLRAE